MGTNCLRENEQGWLWPQSEESLIALPSTSRTVSNSCDNKHSSLVLVFHGNAMYSKRLLLV